MFAFLWFIKRTSFACFPSNNATFCLDFLPKYIHRTIQTAFPLFSHYRSVIRVVPKPLSLHFYFNTTFRSCMHATASQEVSNSIGLLLQWFCLLIFTRGIWWWHAHLLAEWRSCLVSLANFHFTLLLLFLLSMHLLLRNVSFPSFHYNQKCRLSSWSELCCKKAVEVHILVNCGFLNCSNGNSVFILWACNCDISD